MLLVGTQMKYLVITKQVGKQRCMWMISTQPASIAQLCGTRNTMENCYSFAYFIHVAQCAGRWLWFILDQKRQLASQLATMPEQCHIHLMSGGSLCLQELINMKQFSLTVCADREHSSLQSTDSQQWTTVFKAQCTILINDKSASSLSLSPSISMARVNMVNI